MSAQGTVPGRRRPTPGEVVVVPPEDDAIDDPHSVDASPGEPDALTVRPRSVLEEEREFFLRSLRDLEVEHDAGDIDDADFGALKDDYTVRAAAVIRQLAGDGQAPSGSGAATGSRASEPSPSAAQGSPPVAAPASRQARWPRRWRWTAGVVVAVAAGSLAGLAVHRGSGARMPGQTVSGAPVGAAKDAQLLARAQKAAAAGDAVTALKDCRIILADDPNQAQALAEQGWLLAQTQQRSLQTQGLGDLTRAVALAPTDEVAHLYRGIVLLDVGRKAEGVTDLQWYLDHNPDPQVKGRVEAALVQALAGNTAPAPSGLTPTSAP
ncbi:MAG: hypothetical protein ACR2MN_02855 [Acidimicrobiales bacterium]